jgi:outer membrane protein assembly factor BamB
MSRRALALALLIAFAGGARAAAATPAWTTYRHDAQRTGIDPDSTSPVAPTQRWQSTPLDGAVYGQPLVYGSRVYVATENDSVYALDAGSGAVVWRAHVGTPVPDRSTAGCGDIGNVGITSTPVIDPDAGRIYVVADTWDGSNTSSIAHRMFGFDLTSGATAPALPIAVDPPGSTPAVQLQRVALGLVGGRVLIGFGGNDGDCGIYHGWLVSAPENGAGALLSFEVNPSTHGGAIWGSGNGPAIDPAGRIWVSTGNGFGSTFGFQESVLELDQGLHLVDRWTPANWQTLDSEDADEGSSEPVLLGSGLVLQIGKDGIGYLLSSANLGATGASPLFSASVCPGAGSYGGGVTHGGVIYIACSDGLHALALNAAAHNFAAVPGWLVNSDAIGPPIFAGGLVWSVGWRSGVLYGIDPSTGATRFSQSLQGFVHFASPGAGGGSLFVVNGSTVTAFTIAGAQSVSTPIMSRVRVKARRRLTVTLTLTEAARVTVAIRRARGPTLTFNVQGKQGRNTFRLRHKRLRKGRYTATVTARNSAGSTTRRTLGFRVVH